MSLDYERIAKVLGGTLHDMGEAPRFGIFAAGIPTGVGAVIPYPPSVNRMWRNVNGRTLLSREGRNYRYRVGAACASMLPLSGDVRVRLKVYRPRRSGDLDNCLKGILDALKGFAFTDDKQVVRIEADRLDDKDNPRVSVIVDSWTAAGGANGGPRR